MSRGWTLARFGPKTVLCVMAAEPEYGPALRARIRPLITGVGPVEAAAGVAHALAGLEAEGNLPDVVVSLGSAGSRTLDHGRVYCIAEVSYRDMDASALGFPKGETPYPRLPAVLPLADGPSVLPDWPRAGVSSRGPAMMPWTPTWSIWRPSPSSAPRPGSACR